MKRRQTERPGEFGLPVRVRTQTGDTKRDLMMKQVSEDAPGKAGVFRKVYSGKASPRQAMKAFCLQCCWMDEAVIRDCTATECPLFDFRPYQASRRQPSPRLRPAGKAGDA